VVCGSWFLPSLSSERSLENAVDRVRADGLGEAKQGLPHLIGSLHGVPLSLGEANQD
jgi:hypothetical protein